MSIPADVARIYERAELLDRRYPYAYGGGHDPTFSASPPLHGNGLPGFDCSSWASMLIHAGSPIEMPVPLGTHELEHWALGGYGDHLALRVFNGMLNGIPTEHCAVEFRKGFPAAHRFSMAFFTGGPPCGFISETDFDASLFHARRKRVG